MCTTKKILLAMYLLCTQSLSCGGELGANRACLDEKCPWKKGENSKIRVAFVHHAMDMGGVERQIRLTCAAVDKNSVDFEVLLFQSRGKWADHLDEVGVPVRLFRVWRSKTELEPGHESEISRLVEYIKIFDVVHTWYGGGALGTFHTFPSFAARR